MGEVITKVKALVPVVTVLAEVPEDTLSAVETLTADMPPTFTPFICKAAVAVPAPAFIVRVLIVYP